MYFKEKPKYTHQIPPIQLQQSYPAKKSTAHPITSMNTFQIFFLYFKINFLMKFKNLILHFNQY